MTVNDRTVISVFFNTSESTSVAARRPQVMDFGLGDTAWNGKQKLLLFASQGHGHDEGFDLAGMEWPGHEASEDGTTNATKGSSRGLSSRGRTDNQTGLRSPSKKTHCIYSCVF
jgi:hypothetical protein